MAIERRILDAIQKAQRDKKPKQEKLAKDLLQTLQRMVQEDGFIDHPEEEEPSQQIATYGQGPRTWEREQRGTQWDYGFGPFEDDDEETQSPRRRRERESRPDIFTQDLTDAVHTRLGDMADDVALNDLLMKRKLTPYQVRHHHYPDWATHFDEFNSTQVTQINTALNAARRGGFETVGAIRDAAVEQLTQTKLLGPNRAAFLIEVFSRPEKPGK